MSKIHMGHFTKTISPIPMTRLEYNVYRGWELPSNENGDDEGYLVEFLDGGQANHPQHKGYISWSPKELFDKSYRTSGKMTFGDALELMKQGYKVSRSGWNGKGMWVKMIVGRIITPENLNGDSPFVNKDGVLSILPHIDMFSAGQEQVVGWLASQTDMLSEDWGIVE